jgi:Uma2 family endonuclease
VRQPRRTNPLAATESEGSMSIAPWAEIVPDAPYPMTQEQFEHWPDDGGIYELIAGRLVRQVPSTGLHSKLMKRVYLALEAYAQHHGGWEANPDGMTFRLQLPGGKHPNMVPDSSLARSDRLPPDEELFSRTGWNRILDVAPDLVVEIASEGQTRKIMGEKAQQYLDGGVRLVWNIYPLDRMADIWQVGDKEPTLLGYADWLDGRDVAAWPLHRAACYPDGALSAQDELSGSGVSAQPARLLSADAHLAVMRIAALLGY